MKHFKVVVPWKAGLHLRHATTLVRLAQTFQSRIRIKCHGKIADARSVLSVILLCAALGNVLDIEAYGVDEDTAAQAVEKIFASADDDGDTPDAPGLGNHGG